MTINGQTSYVFLDGRRPMTGELLLANSTPSTALAAASKSYVDTAATAAAQGLDVKGSCRAATTGALAAHGRVGNVLTASANGALAAQDGITLAATDRLLVKDEGAGTHLENGLYTVTQVGTAGTPWILTRTTDADTSAEVTTGLYTFIEEGTTLAGTAWVLRTANPITLNTTALNFTQFGAGGVSSVNGATGAVLAVDDTWSLEGATFLLRAADTDIVKGQVTCDGPQITLGDTTGLGLLRVRMAINGMLCDAVWNGDFSIDAYTNRGGADGGIFLNRNGGEVNIAAASGLIGFFGATPVTQRTGVAVSAAGIHAALVSLGLITT